MFNHVRSTFYPDSLILVSEWSRGVLSISAEIIQCSIIGLTMSPRYIWWLSDPELQVNSVYGWDILALSEQNPRGPPRFISFFGESLRFIYPIGVQLKYASGRGRKFDLQVAWIYHCGETTSSGNYWKNMLL